MSVAQPNQPERVVIVVDYSEETSYYTAQFRGEHPDNARPGTSPDEAIGYLVREAVVAGRIICVVDIENLHDA